MAAAARLPTAVVTGAGTGIGRALAVTLALKGLRVVCVGRRRDTLQETSQLAAASAGAVACEVVPGDVSKEEDRAAIAKKVAEIVGPDGGLQVLVHNAAVMGEVGQAENLSSQGFQNAMAINVEGPLFLTQALLPWLKKGGPSRVLHISSGAAHGPLPGWLSYCTSKAALLQVMRCLDSELGASGVRVGSVMPGVVDTLMQAEIRQKDFPNVQYFKSLGEKTERERGRGAQGPAKPPRDALDRPENVADFLSWLLLDVPIVQFGGKEWDINDPEAQRQWLLKRANL